MDALKTFENEGWSLLKIQTLRDTAKCYEKLNDYEKLVRTCAQMACAKELVTDTEKTEACNKLCEVAKNKLGKYDKDYFFWGTDVPINFEISFRQTKIEQCE